MASAIRPVFPAGAVASESRACQETISTLGLQEHIEGGYFVETDRDTLEIPNPFAIRNLSDAGSLTLQASGGETRNASTTIFYYITPKSPMGAFHRNKGRTVHTLHRGRGRYVLIHANEVKPGEKARVESFVVGHNLAAGETLQWIVEGGKYKASFLLPDEEGGKTSDGLLISETVIPGFDYTDHNFMTRESFEDLVDPNNAKELEWLLRDSLLAAQNQK